MKVNFVTPTKLSLMDITSMGDSAKRGDDSTLGQFDSGLKFAIALLLRSNVNISILVEGEPIVHENWEEPVTEVYYFSTYIEKCSNTGKEKELIEVDCQSVPNGGECRNQYDMREPSESKSWVVKTGFAKTMGYNWQPWMIIRELWSNMLDEGGYVSEERFDIIEIKGTVITLEFDENNPFYEIWQNKHLYVNEKEPLYILNSGVEVLDNPEKYLRIYKQNILVYENKDRYSRFAWNIKSGELDETRILRDLSSVEQNIAQSICCTDNEAFLREIITADFEAEENEFLEKSYTYCTASDLMNKIATELFNEHGSVNSYDWIMEKIKSRKDYTGVGKKLTTIDSHLWNYSRQVTVESKPQLIQEDVQIVNDEVVDAVHPLQREIDKHYNFKLDAEVRTAKLRGSKVVKDGFENCIIISEDFNWKEDFGSFIVEYLDLTNPNKNVVESLAKYIVNLIKK